ncbi:MAG TPA: alpha-galactosidase [Candidatus Eubacterium faecipullorum]|uniref:Alpha-galactosidase n=1 Tax=Candidatus Eubacterium faecipullorum TaxID=2838571 RepID=A0A9D1REV0_9FIRM|nr:alpha-galactosidase [Candidatus Eubacterium faecipullorum]
MFKLKSKKLEREFNVTDGYLYASQITNTYSGMVFIPDGSGSEFEIRFTDGDTLSSKNLAVSEAVEKDGKLFFRFKEEMNTTVTMSYRIGSDGETLEKQIAIEQSEPKVIDYVMLENIGIVNSKSSYTANGGKSEIDEFYSNLGQPFYIDSLFFGCVFPGTKNGVFHGRGEVVYFIGKNATGKIICPTTVMGAAKSAMMVDLRKAFFEYIDRISVKSDFRVQYNTWYDRMMDIDVDNTEAAFYKVESKLSSNGVAPLDGYVIDDGWNNYKADFWSVNQKRFPNGFLDLSSLTNRLGSSFGLWLGPRGGYNFNSKFAKRIERGGFGYYNAESDDICVCSKTYLNNLKEFLVKATRENDIAYWKLDGFALKPCKNQKHDHITGGDHDMYYITELWRRWIKIFKALRDARKSQGKELWINFTCYVNPSPWWLQYVNSIWLQNSGDIGFAENYARNEQSQADAEMTYRDSVYYDFIVTRGLQFPLGNIYNHEPIYGREAHLDYTDEEFEKAFFWNACRGSALCELYISPSMMNDEKWRILARVLKWQRANHHILKNAMLLGGDPAQNNIYCYASWTEDGEGVIALRNPTHEATPLTLTLNKLMGCPEGLKNARRFNILSRGAVESSDLYNYNDKINLTLAPFEVRIFQFGKTDKRTDSNGDVNDFTIVFEYDGNNGVICQNDDILIRIDRGIISVNMGTLRLRSENSISDSNHTVTVVREKNKMVKLYVDSSLDSSAYEEHAKAHLSCELTSDAEGFRIINSATNYSDIVELGGILKKSRKRRR